MRPSPVLSALPAILMLAGCSASAFTSRTFQDGRLVTTVDAALPEAMSELLSTCTLPLTIGDGVTVVHPLSGCGPGSPLSDDALVLASELRGLGAVTIDADLADAVPPLSTTATLTPIDGCVVTVDVDMVPMPQTITDITLSWTNRGGVAALQGEVGTDGDLVVARGIIDATATCDSAIWQALLDAVLPSGLHELRLEHSTLTAWLTASASGGAVVGGAEARVGSTGLALDPPLDPSLEVLVGGVDGLLADLAGITADDIEGWLAAAITDAMLPLADDVAETLEATAPSTHEVCDVRVQRGALKISSAPGC